MNKKHLMLVVLAVTMSGCQEQASNYCEDAPFHNCQDLIDAPIDAPTSCSSNASCTAPLGVCDVTGSKTCVECTATDSAACVGVEPVCGVDQACRACTAHSECTSDVCLPDGSCAAEGDVAYVNGSAGTGSACTKAAPCKTVTAAVATPKTVIKVTGPVNDRVTIGRAVKIFAAPNAELSSTGNGTLLTTTGTAIVEVYDLTIANASGVNVGYGVQVGANTTFAMTRGKITGCREAGLTASGGTVTVTGATVSGNTGGGLSITNSNFKLVNNFIVENGNAAAGGSLFGGVTVGSTATDNVFEQNTVAFNHSLLGNPGATCSAVASFHGKRNIITSNNLGLTFPAAQSSGCADIESYTAAGTDANDLKFAAISPAPLNFHLTAASPATVKDVPGLTTCPGVDIDGNARPVNTFCDLGADEYKP